MTQKKANSNREVVTVYIDPLTKNKIEGKAQVMRVLRKDENLRRALVRFEDGAVVERWID